MTWRAVVLLAGVFLPASIGQAGAADSLTVGSPSLGPSLWVSAGAAAAVGVEALFITPRKQNIPREGLDPENLWLGVDRRGVTYWDHDTDATSDWLLWASVAFPGVERALLGGGSRGDWFNSLGLQLEASLLATAATFGLKSAFSRPRPYTYLEVYDRNGDGTANWATSDQTFESLPSGHASLAWVSSMSRVSLAAINYPERSRTTHFATGVLGGALATTSALLRVEAGTHFPTDVVAGAMVGGGIGLAVPLFHAGALPSESREALTWGLWGTLGGVVLGILVSPPTSPFVR